MRIVIAATHLFRGKDPSPIDFGELPRLIREDFLLTRGEYDELISGPTGLPPHIDFTRVREFIWRDSVGIVGAVRIALDYLKTNIRKANPTAKDAVGKLMTYQFIFGLVRLFGGDSGLDYSDELTSFLAKCLAQGPSDRITLFQNPSDAQKDDECVHALVRRGVLLKRFGGSSVWFSSPLAKRYFLARLFRFRGSESSKPQSLEEMIKRAIPLFSATFLRQSTGSGSFPKEAVFHQMMIQAIAQLTPPHVSICTGLSEIFSETRDANIARISGEVDCFVDEECRWAIELLVQGSGIGEHPERFEPGGKYELLDARDSVVIDFREGVADVRLDGNRATVFFPAPENTDENFSKCWLEYKEQPRIELNLAP